MELDSKSLFTDFSVEEQRTTAVEVYLDELSPDRLRDGQIIADELTAYSRFPLPKTVVTIPVADHTEAPQILPALEQYSKQRGNDPFAIHLFLNHPYDIEHAEGVIATSDAITKGMQLFPELDIRISAMMHDNMPIGSIRNTAWLGSLMAIHGQGDDIINAIGLNHDIDVVALSPYYIARVQNYYKDLSAHPELQPVYLPVRGTQAKHSYSLQHPNSSKITFFSDLYARLLDVPYEASLAIPFATFAAKGGFADTPTYESDTFRPERYLIPGTRLETSMRRFIDRLDRHSLADIWTDESFGPNDNCRTATGTPDVSELTVRRNVLSSTPHYASAIARHSFSKNTSDQDHAIIMQTRHSDEVIDAMIQRAQKVGNALGFALRKVIDVPEAADYVTDHVFSDSSLRFQIAAYQANKIEGKRQVSRAMHDVANAFAAMALDRATGET